MEFNVFRFDFSETATMSTVVADGKHFGYCLEDTVRDSGVKIYGKTAIPAGRYELEITYSPHFKRDVVMLKNVVGFDRIYIHGGNTVEDTLGCLLFAQNRTGFDKVFGSLEARVLLMVKADVAKGIKPYISIFNCGHAPKA